MKKDTKSKGLFGSSKKPEPIPEPKNNKAQDKLENQLKEDTMRLQQYEQRKAERILFDMKYLNDQKYQDECDNALRDDIELIEVDEQFKESYLDIIERFYNLFESIYLYY